MRNRADHGLGALLLLAVLALSCTTLAQEPEVVVIDEIVARVNQETITLSDLNRELAGLRASLRQQFQEPAQLEARYEREKRAILRAIIQNKILVQKAEELGMSANVDVEVAAALEQVRQEAGVPNMEVLDQALRQQGSSLEQYRASLKENFIINSLLQQFVYGKITLLTPEIEEYYQQNAHRFVEPGKVGLREILFLTEGQDMAQVRQRAEDVLAQLQGGASFEQLAQEHSDGPSASQGGDIGQFSQGTMDPAIEEQVFQLDAGQITGIIQTEYGLQILKVVSREESQQREMEEVRDQIANELYQKKAQPELKEFVDELIEQSYIYVAPRYRDEFDLEGVFTASANGAKP